MFLFHFSKEETSVSFPFNVLHPINDPVTRVCQNIHVRKPPPILWFDKRVASQRVHPGYEQYTLFPSFAERIFNTEHILVVSKFFLYFPYPKGEGEIAKT